MLVASTLFWSEIKQINQGTRAASPHHAFFPASPRGLERCVR